MVTLLDEPGIAPVLGLTWVGVLAMLLVASRIGKVSGLVPLLLIAAALLVTRPGEMWYWPAAALAYLPSFAGLGAAALLLARPNQTRLHHAALCAALVIGAGSSEVGALAVAAVCGGVILCRLASQANLIPADNPAPLWSILAPFLFATCILGFVAAGRVGAEVEAFGDLDLRGDLWASLAVAVGRWPKVVAGVPLPVDGQARIWFGLPVKIGLLVGFWALLGTRGAGDSAMVPRIGGTRIHRLHWPALAASLALFAVPLATLMLGFYQFGLVCCQRHGAFSQAAIVLAIFLLAAALPQPPAWLRGAGAPILAAALVVPLALRGPAFGSDLALVPLVRETRSANWTSGRTPGEAMVYRSEPIGRVTSGWALGPGEFRRLGPTQGMPPGAQGHPFAIMVYFDKMVLQSPGAMPHR